MYFPLSTTSLLFSPATVSTYHTMPFNNKDDIDDFLSWLAGSTSPPALWSTQARNNHVVDDTAVDMHPTSSQMTSTFVFSSQAMKSIPHASTTRRIFLFASATQSAATSPAQRDTLLIGNENDVEKNGDANQVQLPSHIILSAVVTPTAAQTEQRALPGELAGAQIALRPRCFRHRSYPC